MRDRIAEEVRKGDQADRAKVEGDKAKIADTLRYECLRNPDAKMKLRTRYIQDQPAPVRREAEGAIGSWLVSPHALRYQAVTG